MTEFTTHTCPYCKVTSAPVRKLSAFICGCPGSLGINGIKAESRDTGSKK